MNNSQSSHDEQFTEDDEEKIMPLKSLSAGAQTPKLQPPGTEAQSGAQEPKEPAPAFPPQMATPPIEEKEQTRYPLLPDPDSPLFGQDVQYPPRPKETSIDERLSLLRKNDPDVRIAPVACTIVFALLAVLAPVAYFMLYPAIEQQVRFDDDMRNGQKFFEQGRLLEARKMFDAAIVECKKLGDADPRYLTAHIWRAKVALATSEYDQAKSNLLMFLSKPDALNASSSETCEALCNLGQLYCELGEFDESRIFFDKALASADNATDTAVRKARILHGMASLALRQSLYAKAKDYLEQALALLKSRPDAPVADTASVINDLGIAFEQEKQYTEAESYFKQALQLRERQLAPEHPDIAESLLNLGGLANHNGQTKEAASYFDRALKISEEALGKNSLEVAKTLEGLSASSERANDLPGAISYLKRSLDIKQSLFGPSDPRVIHTHRVYCDLLLKMNAAGAGPAGPQSN